MEKLLEQEAMLEEDQKVSVSLCMSTQLHLNAAVQWIGRNQKVSGFHWFSHFNGPVTTHAEGAGTQLQNCTLRLKMAVVCGCLLPAVSIS